MSSPTPPVYYAHIQVGWAMIIVSVIAAVIVVGGSIASGLWWLGPILAVVVLSIGGIFSTLSVGVVGHQLRIAFGPGFIRRDWNLDDIVRVEAVRNPWYTGWGIRFNRGTTIYNVAGFGAVEVEMRNGRRYRIGSDEPEALRDAILHACATRG